MSEEFAQMKNEIEVKAKEYLINNYGENFVKSVILRKRLLVIKTDSIKTKALDKLLNSTFEKKFGNEFREKQLAYTFKYINPKVD
jgi:hypothetical protein